jgi:3-oxocholest-4-en-26-oyl-CoA dehydrogenase beta subunit
VTLERQVATTGEPVGLVTLTRAKVHASDVLGDPSRGRALLEWLVPRATVALCAMELGVAGRVLRTTAKYTSERHQFDRPIATFQAVAQRAADAYVDVETIRVATWQAAWRLANGLPATAEVLAAKYWASEAGHRVVYAAQHLHGGMGYDVDYPLYRYYLLSKQIELALGGAEESLAKLGDAMKSSRFDQAI